jgi:hypothetical protein
MPSLSKLLLSAVLLGAPAVWAADPAIVGTPGVDHDNAASVTPDNGATSAAGDTQLVYGAARPNASRVIAVDGSHTLVNQRPNSTTTGATYAHAMWSKSAGVAVADPTVSCTGCTSGDTVSAIATVVSGLDVGGTLVHAVNDGTNSSTTSGSDQVANTPGLTITNDRTFIVMNCHFPGTSTGVSYSVAGFTSTLAGGAGSTTLGNDMTVAQFTKYQAVAANLPAGTITYQGAGSPLLSACIVQAFNAAPIPPDFSGTIPTQALTKGTAMTTLNTASYFTGSPTSYAIGSCTLPGGLSFNTSTGALTGTPTTPVGATGCVVTATNGAGSDVSNAFNITIAAPADKLFLTLGSISNPSWIIDWNADPDNTDIAVGDILEVPTITWPSSYALNWYSGGRFCYPWNGTLCTGGDESRQLIQFDHWRTATSAWTVADDKVWVDDPGIRCDFEAYPVIKGYKIGTAQDLIDYGGTPEDPVCRHLLGDALTLTTASGTPPAGVGITGLVQDEDGTSTENEAGAALTMRLTSNVSGIELDVPSILYPLNTLTRPNCLASSMTGADCALLAPWLNTQATFSCRRLTPQDRVVAQAQAAGDEAEPFSDFDITVAKHCPYLDGVIQ